MTGTRRLAGMLEARTAVPCALTNLAADGVRVTDVLERQLPLVAGRLFGPDRIHPNASGHRLLAAACGDLLMAG